MWTASLSSPEQVRDCVQLTAEIEFVAKTWDPSIGRDYRQADMIKVDPALWVLTVLD